MKFKEQFPNLKGMATTFFDIHGNVNHPMDDVYTYSDIEEHCLDKQLVKEAYLLLKTSLGKSFFDVTQSPYAKVMLEFEKKLGLEE